jgi:hypothetical protein
MADPTTEQSFRRVADIAFEVLYAQRIFVERDKFVVMDAAGNINGKALGYVFGFLDGLLQSSKLDIRGTDGHATMHSLLARLFPAEVNKTGTYVSHLRNMSDDPEIMDGVMLEHFPVAMNRL